MAITRLSQSSIKEGLEKFPSFYGGFSPVFGSMEAIETVTVGSGGAASISFTSIPGTYQHLQIRLTGRTDRSNTIDNAFVSFNGDTGNNYASHWLYGNGSSALTLAVNSDRGGMLVGRVAGNNATANAFGSLVIDILDYADTAKNTTIRALCGSDNNGNGQVNIVSGLWMNTAAITSIALPPDTGPNWLQHTTAALFGVKAP